MAILIIVAFFVLFILGFPVVLSIAIPGITYILWNHITIDLIAQRLHYALNSFPLLAVPVFILVGNLMNSTGVTKRIFKFADVLVGRMPGGLAQVNIFASLIFSGMSGAALADIGGLGQIELEAMREKGFSNSFSGAVTIASATVGPIFPPSIPLVIYGAVTGTSVVKLLIGGIIPAITAVVMMMILTAFLSIIRKYPRAERWPRLSEIFRAFFPALPALMAPVMLVLGMLTGIFTPTEAASITVIYIIFISCVIYKEFTFKGLINSAFETVKMTAGIMIIISVASLFSWIFAIEQVPGMFSKFILNFSQNPYILLLIINMILLIVGMFLDSTTATLLIIPIITPPIVAAGVDPVHLGIVVIFNLMIGLMTPPMGLSLFLISDIAKVPMSKVLHDVYPYFIILVVTLIIITYIPQLTLYIPNLLMK